MSLSLYFHTVRHLKAQQVYGRVLHKLHRPLIDLSAAPARREQLRGWVATPAREPSLSGSCEFSVVGQVHDVRSAADWNDASCPRLLLYNLHYFDDLNAEGAAGRRSWHEALIERWIRENPPAEGVGWEAYPLSLRIVNWTKWSFSGTGLSPDAQQSLAVQARCLAKSIEYHLLGNHLLANAKGLIFAGLYFRGKEAEEWRTFGLHLFLSQLREQILADGGHFELSPMYHSIVLEDVLDVVNGLQACDDAAPSADLQELLATAAKMFQWLRTMSHCDGEFALFSDAAFGIAPNVQDLASYGERLGVDTAAGFNGAGVTHLRDSGYCRVASDDALLIADVGHIGPEHLPAHGHADVLSFELDLFGRRFIVDSGTSQYGNGPARLQEKGTAAHNTVVVDNQDSSEMWGSFRVARRARPFDVKVESGTPVTDISAAHDGYQRLPGKITHRRHWKMSPRLLDIVDEITGSGTHSLSLYLHLHPDAAVRAAEDQVFFVQLGDCEKEISVRFDSRVTAAVEESRYHPRFGANIGSHRLAGSIEAELPVTVRTTIEW